MMSDRLSSWRLAVFASPIVAHSLYVLPMGVVLPAFYAQNTAADMAAIGAVAGISRLFDAVTDPLIGLMSDRTNSTLGRRKPWIIAAALVSAVSIFFLFQPPADATIYYYAFWSFAIYLGFTLFDIPFKAWGAELTHNYDQRSRISAFVSVGWVVGSLMFWVFLLVYQLVTGTGEITAGAYSMIALAFIILAPVSTMAAVRFVPNGPPVTAAAPSLRAVARSVFGNKPLCRFLAAYCVWGIGNGVYLSVVFIFMTGYLNLGASFAILMIVFFTVQIIAMPFWTRMMEYTSKHRVWAFSWGVTTLIFPLALFFEQGSAPVVGALALTAVLAFVNAASYIGPIAVLGDIVDYDLLRTRTRNAGNFFALYTLISKGIVGLGVAVAFPFLSAFGYTIGGENDDFANLGLIIAYIVIPGATSLIAAMMLWGFPITRARHAVIQRRIESPVFQAGLPGRDTM